MGLKRWALIIFVVLLVLVFFVYRSRQASRGLNVEPHAAREIEKANTPPERLRRRSGGE
jgi:hypothetical protein